MNQSNICSIIGNHRLTNIPIKNLSIDYFDNFYSIVELFQSSIENFELRKGDFDTFDAVRSSIGGFPKIKSLNLINCRLDRYKDHEELHLPTLKEITFNDCNHNIFKIFQKQCVEKITVRNDTWGWNGFPHDVLAQMLGNVKHLVLIGSGTGSFFDYDHFPFKLTTLDTTMITFHWYVGIRTGRTGFLETQKGTLKELTIHSLPMDFDGGIVLKYIMEMGLEKFYYGKIPLILDGRKQEMIKEFSATELNISSMIEMFTQFPSKQPCKINKY